MENLVRVDWKIPSIRKELSGFLTLKEYLALVLLFPTCTICSITNTICSSYLHVLLPY